MASQINEKPSLFLTRIYPVAPEKVWRAWTDPQALKHGFGLHEQLFDVAARDRHEYGWTGSLAKLGRFLQDK